MKYKTLAEIETRKAAILSEMEQEGADLEALKKEMDELRENAQQIRDAAAKAEDAETKEEAVLREVRTGRYGRCAFHSGNDVADWQRVTVFTREGVTLDIEMDGLSPDEGRRTILTGTRGRIIADGAVITVEPSLEPSLEAAPSCPPSCLSSCLSSRPSSRHIDLSADAALPFHAGADFLLVDDFLHAVHDPSHTPLTALPSTRDSLLVCFAASLSL